MIENKNEKQLKYENELDFGGKKVKCYVLEDGTRCFDEKGFETLLGLEFNVKCHLCQKEVPKWNRLLERLETEKPKVFEELMLEMKKGLRLICEPCENIMTYNYHYDHGFNENSNHYQWKNSNCEECKIWNQWNDYRYEKDLDKFSKEAFGEWYSKIQNDKIKQI